MLLKTTGFLFAFVVLLMLNLSSIDHLSLCLQREVEEVNKDTILKVSVSVGKRFIIHERRTTLESSIKVVPRGYVKTLDTFEIRGAGSICDVFVTDLNHDGNKEVLIVTNGTDKFPIMEVWAFETLNNERVRVINVEVDDFNFIQTGSIKDNRGFFVNRFYYSSRGLRESQSIFLSSNHYWMPNHFVYRHYVLVSDSSNAKLFPIPVI